MAWFREARYGIFIHWGLYSQRADTFNPVKFEADAIAEKVAVYGGKYLCFTAKHHDGFAMYDSQASDYNIMHTPFGRDVVKELSMACEKRGIVFCLSKRRRKILRSISSER